MRPATLVRLAFAGSRADTLRVALTALSALLATLAVLAAATMLAIPEVTSPDNPRGYATQYNKALLREPGLRPGVVFALALLTLPVLALAGQCGRLGAPARDRRLAAVRMAGATPRQAVALAAAETGLASVVGVGVGFGVYFVGRRALHRPAPAGRLPLPTDVLPAWPALLAVAVGLPLVATLVAAVVLRRVRLTPFGVVRAQRRRGPGPWPAFLIVPGVACFALFGPVARYSDRHGGAVPERVLAALLFGGALLALVGLLLGTGWISHMTGRVLYRVARRPAALLAGRRLAADPWAGSRVFAAVLACVLFGGGAAGVRAYFVADAAVQEEGGRWTALQGGFEYIPDSGDSFYTRTMTLVDAAVLVGMAIAVLGLLVALAEGIVARRRTYATLVATGVPRGVLARSLLWQTLAPVVPAVAAALAVGLTMTRSLMSEVRIEAGYALAVPTDGQPPPEPHFRVFTHDVPIPFAELALFGGGAILAVLAMTGLALLFLRPSMDPEELRTT
ncbi:FtsX-like permease family protein [Frankia nepalensis]|uniref:FtsX-like permease family protein n=1 Tax=Frankia nepalensis TaxID=1836974 RepID=UPI0019312C71|nr:FtsX-like permease family protein [Frankia nepalensis]MBL7512331.1 ABC transporter permease [Frankia nepalensis]